MKSTIKRTFVTRHLIEKKVVISCVIQEKFVIECDIEHKGLIYFITWKVKHRYLQLCKKKRKSK